jgi:hypothetical protein
MNSNFELHKFDETREYNDVLKDIAEKHVRWNQVA